MRAGLKRTATMLFVAATAGLIGCDSSEHEADRKARANLTEAHDLMLASDKGEEVHSKFTAAAAEAGASAPVRAGAKGALAQSELEIANATILKIDHLEMQLAQVAWEVSQQAEQIRSSSSAVIGYKKYDPQPARDKIALLIADAQGGAGKPAWFTNGSTTIPTLSAVKQEQSRLEGEIAQVQEQVRNITADRDKLLTDAEAAATQAETLKGDQGLEVFKRSSDLRRQAGGKSVELDKLNSQLSRLQRDLAISQGQLATLNEVIEQLRHQGESLDAGWKDIDQQVARQQQLSVSILGSPGAAPTTNESAANSSAGASISKKAVEWARLAKEIAELRDSAQTSLDNAVKYFDDAYKAADQNRQALKADIDDPKNANRPEIASWKNMIETLDPVQFKIRQAAAQRTRGALYASDAASILRRNAALQVLTGAITGTGMKAPDMISAGDAAKPIELANIAYDESDKSLADVIEGNATDSVKTHAHISRALTLYGWSLVAHLQGNEPVSSERIQTASKERDLASESGAVLPSLPSELGEPPKATSQPAEAPATAPADAPTTAPAEAAPATAPAP